MKIEEQTGSYSVYRFGPDQPVPVGALSESGFVSVTRTEEELSVVCQSGSLPGSGREESGWSLWKVQGPLDFGMLGVLSAITAPLAAAEVSVFAVSTFDTDYILWKRDRTPAAINALQEAGFELRPRR